MSVELDPAELGFKRPFQQEVSQVLRLRNPNSDPVAFKVKTTAPKQYCVRPNAGRIEAGKEVEVQVLLQAMKEDPPLDAKCRDKFLVQSVAVSADQEFNNAATIWSQIEQTNKSAIQEKKIRVFFLPADSAAASTPPANTNGLGSELSHRSPSPEAVTPQKGVTSAPVGPVSRIESRPAESKNLGDAVNSTFNPATSSGVAATASSVASKVANAIPTSDDVSSKLADTRSGIENLGRERSNEGLRQRNVAGGNQGSEGTAAPANGLAMQQAAPGGVSIPIVASLCLLSFLLAYLLF